MSGQASTQPKFIDNPIVVSPVLHPQETPNQHKHSIESPKNEKNPKQ